MAMGKLPATGILFALVYGLTVTGYASGEDRPPLSGIRIGGEILAGSTGGFAGVILPILALDSESSGNDFSLGGAWAMLIALAAYPIGSALGVYLVGEIGNETGAFLPALVGAILGEILGINMASWTESPWISHSILVLCGPVGATIGFNLSRKYELSVTSSEDQMSNADSSIRLDLLRVKF